MMVYLLDGKGQQGDDEKVNKPNVHSTWQPGETHGPELV